MTTTASHFRLPAVVGLVIFLVLTGTGLAQALWTASSTHTTTVAAGKITVAFEGAGLTAKDIRTNAWSTPTTVTMRNTSSVDVTTKLAFTTTGTLETQRVQQVQLALWPRTGPSCATAPGTVPAAATTSPLTTPTLPGAATTLKAGTSSTLCAATRMTGELSGTAGKTLTATPVVTATYPTSTWSATATGAAFTHTMAPAPNPVASITCENLSNGRIRLNWPAVTGATSYQVEAPQRTREVSVPSVELTRADTGGTIWEYRTVTITALGATGDSPEVSTRVGVIFGALTCP